MLDKIFAVIIVLFISVPLALGTREMMVRAGIIENKSTFTKESCFDLHDDWARGTWYNKDEWISFREYVLSQETSDDS